MAMVSKSDESALSQIKKSSKLFAYVDGTPKQNEGEEPSSDAQSERLMDDSEAEF